MRLPDPVIPHPYREIEVSRPDPNLFLEHTAQVATQQTEVHNHVIHHIEQRSAAMDIGERGLRGCPERYPRSRCLYGEQR